MNLQCLFNILCRSVTFTDDIKFFMCIVTSFAEEVQIYIDIVEQWSIEYDMLLSVEKSFVMFGESCQLMCFYLHQVKPLAQVDDCRDLCVMQSLNGMYSGHCIVTAKNSRAAGAIRHAFRL